MGARVLINGNWYKSRFTEEQDHHVLKDQASTSGAPSRNKRPTTNHSQFSRLNMVLDRL